MKSVTGTIPCDSESLEKLFHSHGVNMRYLGLVYKELKTVPKKKEGEAQAETELQELQNNGDYKHLQTILEKEMFLRSAKHVLSMIMREQLTSDLYVTSVVSHLLNCIFAPNGQLEALDSGKMRWTDTSLLQSQFDFYPEATFQSRSRSSSMCSTEKQAEKPAEKEA